MLKRALFILSLLLLAITSRSWGQTRLTNMKPGSEEAKAFAFFAQIDTPSFDDYLKHVRLPKVSAAHKAQVLTLVAKGEAVTVTDRMRAKLAALAPVLNYHERGAVIEIRVTSAKEMHISLHGRAALLISETALNQLPVEELQATVAHELGHEYFWGELMEARQQKQLEMIREIELRCDGIAVITLRRLGLDPAKLAAALTRIRTFNTRVVSTDSRYHPARDERERFIRAMGELVKAKHNTLVVNQ